MDLRTPVQQSNLVVVEQRDTPWSSALCAHLAELGFDVALSAPGDGPREAFVRGAAGLVRVPAAQEEAQLAWLAVVERAGRSPPTTLVVLAAAPEPTSAEAVLDRERRALQWLAAGFDDHASDREDPRLIAEKLVARMRYQVVRHRGSTVDQLTGLPTHHAFFSRLDPMLRLSSRSAMPMSVAVVDMDGFVALEQLRGRPAVARLITDIAHHLQASLRRSDTVARLGDDRFGLILHHINGVEARRLLAKLWRSLTLEPATLDLLGPEATLPTFSAGVAVFPDDATEGSELYTRAEIALDVARATSGHRRVLLFSETSGDSGMDLGHTDLRLHRTGDHRSEPE